MKQYSYNVIFKDSKVAIAGFAIYQDAVDFIENVLPDFKEQFEITDGSSEVDIL